MAAAASGNDVVVSEQPEWIDGVWRPPADAFENRVDSLEGLDFALWAAELCAGRVARWLGSGAISGEARAGY